MWPISERIVNWSRSWTEPHSQKTTWTSPAAHEGLWSQRQQFHISWCAVEASKFMSRRYRGWGWQETIIITFCRAMAATSVWSWMWNHAELEPGVVGTWCEGFHGTALWRMWISSCVKVTWTLMWLFRLQGSTATQTQTCIWFRTPYACGPRVHVMCASHTVGPQCDPPL